MRRREFTTGLLGLGMAGLPTKLLSEISIGAATLTTVSDGHLILPASSNTSSVPQDELQNIRAEYGIRGDQLKPECNLALFRDGQNTVLFDVGSGPNFMPSAGKVWESLDAVGLGPEDITHVVFTHAHPDHIWGVLDDFEEVLFSNATYLMGRKEWDYWWNPSTVDEIEESRKIFAVGAKRRMEAIEDVVEFFDDGDEILPGISAMASFGHTPGHMSFEIGSGQDRLVVVGDAIVNHHVAFARPDWPSDSDHFKDQAIQTRTMLLDRLASEKLQIVGFHLPNGGIGHVERKNDVFRFVEG